MGIPLFLAQRQAAGNIIMIDPDGREQSMDTVACGHCGAHWVPVRGSGRLRGWCGRHGVLCGAQQCYATCASQEELVEQIEAAARMARSLEVLRS